MKKRRKKQQAIYKNAMPGGSRPQAPSSMDTSVGGERSPAFHGFIDQDNNSQADEDETPVSMSVITSASSSTLRQYTSAFKAPFTVYIRESTQCRMSPLSCSSYIHGKYKSVIDMVQNHGKMRVQLSDRIEANCLVEDPLSEGPCI